MIKIIKNPFLNTNEFPELSDKKYIFEAEMWGIPVYAKLGLKPLIGFVIYAIKGKKG